MPKEPDPYTLVESQPIDAYVFDRELDEYVIKKGYVSEDGLIDDQSVVIDPKAGKITMKYRGGVPVTWDWWKAKDTGDLPEEGSWAAEYLYREFHQLLDDLQPGILKHQGSCLPR